MIHERTVHRNREDGVEYVSILYVVRPFEGAKQAVSMHVDFEMARSDRGKVSAGWSQIHSDVPVGYAAKTDKPCHVIDHPFCYCDGPSDNTDNMRAFIEGDEAVFAHLEDEWAIRFRPR